MSAGVNQSIITEEDTKQSSVSPVSLGDQEISETMSKLHPLLKGDLEDTQSDRLVTRNNKYMSDTCILLYLIVNQLMKYQRIMCFHVLMRPS